MSDETGSPAGQEAIALPADAPETFDTPTAAADYYRELRAGKPEKEQAESAEADEPATAEQESAPQEQDSAPETDPAETTEEAEPAKEPPIERPRSWAKDDDDEWNALPRARQEKIAANERARELDIRQRTNDIAEQRKAAQAEREAAEKVRQQYEAQLPALMERLNAVSQANFSDVRTMEDVRKLQAEDPFRFQAWQVHQMDLQAAKAETDRVQYQQNQSRQGKRDTYEVEQTKKLKELVPEFSDAKKYAETKDRVRSMLTDPDDIGLKTDELQRWFADDTGHEILSHAGMQKLMTDGLKYRDLLKAPKAVAKPTLPPVQRPGTSKPSGSSVSEREQALTRRLNETGDLAAAQELRQLQMRRA